MGSNKLKLNKKICSGQDQRIFWMYIKQLKVHIAVFDEENWALTSQAGSENHVSRLFRYGLATW